MLRRELLLPSGHVGQAIVRGAAGLYTAAAGVTERVADNLGLLAAAYATTGSELAWLLLYPYMIVGGVAAGLAVRAAWHGERRGRLLLTLLFISLPVWVTLLLLRAAWVHYWYFSWWW